MRGVSRDEMKTLMAELAAPFDPREVKFKPGAVSGNRALALPYVDARVVQDRLDDVLGLENWQDTYTPLPDCGVVCELRCRIGGEWIMKTDVGCPSEQPDGGDRLKAAFSDALKRAAVKFGIGRYLYRLPAQWADFDPQKRRFAKTPQLPRQAVPADRALGEPPAPAPTARASDHGFSAGISEAQWNQLRAACGAKGIGERRLLAHFAVSLPRQLPAARFPEALSLIQAPNSVLQASLQRGKL
jgi:hypothetical protein